MNLHVLYTIILVHVCLNIQYHYTIIYQHFQCWMHPQDCVVTLHALVRMFVISCSFHCQDITVPVANE